MEQNKKLGVTHAIREKLNFRDERLWKRFSARRLELIDTLDLSSRKASEQEQEIRRVSEMLRLEFDYPASYTSDFNKLVRAAIQSVRRNRKRSSKKHTSPEESSLKKRKLVDSDLDGNGNNTNSFLSEIVRNEEDVYDVNYNREKRFTSDDQAKGTIENMTKPRLPPLTNFSMNKTINIPLAAVAKKNILNKIEKSRSCNESVNSKLENLQFLGKSVMSTCIGYIFEKSFLDLNPQSMLYLRNKLNSEASLGKFFRQLDPVNTSSINDETAVISLYTLLGAMVKDFGFEDIIFPICEILYASVLQEYPLMAKNSIPFRSEDQYLGSNITHPPENDVYSLNKLAEVASHLQNTGSDTSMSTMEPSRSVTPTPSLTSSYKKRVYLKFFNQKLEFLYPVRIAATPRYNELLENAKSAFKLPDTTIVFKHHGKIVQSDLELERVFKSDEDVIELEISTHNPMPIYEMHKRLSQQGYQHPTESQRIILPPPINTNATMNNGSNLTSRLGLFNFLSNSEDALKPPLHPQRPILPNFQPLL